MLSNYPNHRAIALLLLACTVLIGAVAALCIAPRETRSTRPYQQATGGIGLGAAVAPAWSFFAFDPRTEGTCENELFPIPGLTCYSPYHGALAADLPPLETPARRALRRAMPRAVQ